MVTTEGQDRQLDKKNMITTDNDKFKFNNHELPMENRQEALHAKKPSISLRCTKKRSLASKETIHFTPLNKENCKTTSKIASNTTRL